jgi:hypothetical protein
VLLGAAAGIELLIAVAVALRVAFGPLDHGDAMLFLGFVEPLTDGRVPYRDFSLEYPPLGYLAIIFPWLATGAGFITGSDYHALFTLEMAALAAITGACVAWLSSRGWGFGTPVRTVFTYVLLALTLLPVVMWRFDILPACLTAVALVGVAVRRPGLAGVALGLGAVAKIYPALLLPVALAFYVANGERRHAAILVAGFAISAALVLAPFTLAAGPDVLSFLAYQDERGVQIESVFAGVVLLVHTLSGTDAQISFASGAHQLSSTLVDALSLPRQIAEVALGAGLLAGGWLGFRSDLRRFGAVTTQTLTVSLFAVLLLVVLGNKVLSPQYLVWLLPFAALATRAQATLLFAAGVLTTIEYPLYFDALLRLDPLMVLVLNVRNLLLLLLFLLLVVDLARSRSRADPSVAIWPPRTQPTGCDNRCDAGGAPTHAIFVRLPAVPHRLDA